MYSSGTCTSQPPQQVLRNHDGGQHTPRLVSGSSTLRHAVYRVYPVRSTSSRPTLHPPFHLHNTLGIFCLDQDVEQQQCSREHAFITRPRWRGRERRRPQRFDLAACEELGLLPRRQPRPDRTPCCIRHSVPRDGSHPDIWWRW